MRLRERDKRTLTVMRPAGMREDVYRFDEPHTIRACLYPGDKRRTENAWGQETAATLQLLAERGTDIGVGYGVCVADTRSDYVVTAIEEWDHIRATLEWIPPERRSGDGA